MSSKRAAAYIGGASVASLMLAWLASAAGTVWQAADPQEPARPVRTTGTETLATDVQAQTERLRERLATAPVPQEPFRNPFAFAPRELVRPSRAIAALPPIVPPPVAPSLEPPLSLVGVAEEQSPTGSIRTAVIGADRDEIFFVRTGDTIAARYRVTAIGEDAVELTDLLTGGVRRLALR